ncbi:MAG: hypothetical protein V1866_00645 [archaeon]
MNINTFFNEFTKEIDLLLEEGVFIGLEDVDRLENGTYTLLFDVAIYNIAKRDKMTVRPENPTGRGGYSDMTLYSKNGNKKLIEIEHENRPLRKNNGKYALYKSLDNLIRAKIKADIRILITFTSSNLDKDKLNGMCTKYLAKNCPKPKRNGIYLFFADDEYECGKHKFTNVML